METDGNQRFLPVSRGVLHSGARRQYCGFGQKLTDGDRERRPCRKIAFTLALNSSFFCRFAAGFNTLDLPAALFSSDSSSDPPFRRRNWHGIVGRSRLLHISSALPCSGDGDDSSTSIQSCGSSVSSYHGGRNATIPPFVLRSAGRQLRSGWPAASQQTMASVHDSKSRSGLMPCVGSSAATHVRGEGGWEASIFSTS